jgi:hypothetical protein
MSAKRGKFVLIAGLLLLTLILSACQMPASESPTPTPGESEVQTQAAQTQSAELTLQAELAIPATQTVAADAPTQAPVDKPPTFTPTQPQANTPAATQTQSPPTATSTQAPPTATFTAAPPTATFTAAPPTATPTLAVDTITAVIDTNCRQGPGGSFAAISGLRAGRTSEVYGRDTGGNWWFIQRPGGKANEYCWVWADTTEVSGDEEALPVIPPYPPQLSPAASQWYFSVAAVNIHNCTVPTAFIMVQNAGFVAFESARVEIFNASSQQVLDDTTSNQPFVSQDRDCSGGFDVLSQDVAGYVRGGVSGALSGEQIAANITLCREDNLSGDCYFESISFIMP